MTTPFRDFWQGKIQPPAVGNPKPEPEPSVAPVTPHESNPFAEFIDNSQKLSEAARASNPNRADRDADVLYLSQKTGLDTAVVARDIEGVRRQAMLAGFDPGRYAQRFPNTAKWLAEKPEHVSAAFEDLSKLGKVERFFRAIKRGFTLGHEEAALGEQYNRIEEGAQFTDEEQHRLMMLERDVASQPGGLKFYEQPVYLLSKMFGQLYNALPETVQTSLAGTLAAGGLEATAVAVGAGGLAVGETPLLVAGAGLGAIAGAFHSFFKTSAGNTYATLGSLRDADGNPLDESVKQYASVGAGALSASLMFLGGDVATAPLQSLGARLVRQSAADALVRPTMLKALQDLGLSYAKAAGAGVSTMTLQEVSNIAAEEFAKEASGQKFETAFNSPAQREKIVRRIGTAVKEATETMALAAFPLRGVAGVRSRFLEARVAERNALYFRALGETLEGTKLAEKLPNELQRLVQYHTQDGPIEHVYLPIETWNDYWAKKNVDPRSIAAQILGESDSYDRASESGGDLQIPTATYAAKIAPTEHNSFFAQELRTAPLTLNAREAGEAIKEAVKAAEQPEPPAAPVEVNTEVNAAARELREEGATPEQARTYAQLFEEGFREIKAEEASRPALFRTIEDVMKALRGRAREGGKVKRTPEEREAALTKQAREYQEAVKSAELAASEGMVQRVMDLWRREQSKVFEAEREQTRQQVIEEIQNNPVLRARAILQDGTLPGGRPLPDGMEPFKLSSEALLQEYSESHTRKLASMSAEDGMHPDMAAEVLGFDSGQQLVNQLLLDSEDPNEYIEKRTTQIMRAKKTNLQLLTTTELPTEAMRAVHSEKRAQLLQKELEILAQHDLPKMKGMIRMLAARVPKLEDLRRQAQLAIAGMKVRDIRANAYLAAERRANIAAHDAFVAGDIQEAFNQKQKELLNHELFRAASDAHTFIDRALDYMRKFDRTDVRARLGKAGFNYLEQIDQMRERFDFARVSDKALRKREALAKFLEEQEKQGIPTNNIPEALKNEAYRVHYKNLPYAELQGVYNATRFIERLARLKNRLLASDKARTFDEVRTAVTTQIRKHYAKALDAPPTLEHSFESAKNINAQFTKMEWFFKKLDGYEQTGPVWRAFLKPIQEAETTEGLRFRATQKAIGEIFSPYSRLERFQFGRKKYYVRELNKSFTKIGLFAMALNQGNLYNRKALLDGYRQYGWTEQGIASALSLLDKRDWDTVQKIWDHLDSYWPDITALHKEITGLEPTKVEAAPVQTKYGEYKGGYYPIAFDHRIPLRRQLAESLLGNDVKDLFGRPSAWASTEQGHLNERTNTQGKPLLLTFSPLENHIADVIHDLSFRRAVIDLNKLIADPEIASHIRAAAGDALYGQLKPWLVAVAKNERGQFSNQIEKMLAAGRQGATIVHLGFRLVTAAVHIPNFSYAIQRLGGYAARGIMDTFATSGSLKGAYRFVTESSPYMKERFTTFDRDVRDSMKRMQLVDVKGGPLSLVTGHSAAMQAHYFSFIHAMIMGGSLPTWLGAYRKAMDGGFEGVPEGNHAMAIDAADAMVRETWSAGAIKDLSAIQRGPEAWRWFTMFMTFSNNLYNQMQAVHGEYKVTGNRARLMSGMMLTWFIPALATSWIRGNGPSLDDEPDAWAKWIAKAEVEWPLQTIPILRDMVYPLLKGKGDYYPSSVFDLPENLVRVGQALEKKFEDDVDFTRRDWERLTDTVGIFAKLPTKQLWQTISRLYDYMTGERDVESVPSDIYHTLIAQSSDTRAPRSTGIPPEQMGESRSIYFG